jgi:hypothetical protein
MARIANSVGIGQSHIAIGFEMNISVASSHKHTFSIKATEFPRLSIIHIVLIMSQNRQQYCNFTAKVMIKVEILFRRS